jgi:molybdenum cofactor cytidylyltransferase
MLALLILAAGESSRMGSPKALLKISDETFAVSIARKARSSGVNSSIVITGADHEAIARHLSPQMKCVKNENHMKGQISSLQAGIRAFPYDVTAVLVWPVDQPLVEIETVGKIITAFEDEQKALTIPLYQKRRGHPVLYDKRAMEAALALQPGQTGKDLQSLFANELALVNVEDPGVVTDIDTPEDYIRLIKPS